ncbi:hypothetical protein FACS189427_05230 [Planctomycetales bacterium]|nr:hypothetical protein FACS189427_05230 [Planctomycetales bacterium]
MTILDTNSILRCILQDNAEIAAIVESEMNQSEFTIPTEVLAEAAYVLHESYHVERKTVSAVLIDAIKHSNALIEQKEAVEIALFLYGTANRLDFVDCVLYGYAKAEGHKISTFDNALSKKLNQR